MLGLIEPNRRSAGQCEPGDRSPALFVNLREGNAFGCELLHLLGEVVAQEIDLIRRPLIGRVKGDLGGRHLEDEPTAARIDAGHAQDVTKELTVRLGVVREDDDVRSEDHGRSFLLAEWPPHYVGDSRR